MEDVVPTASAPRVVGCVCLRLRVNVFTVPLPLPHCCFRNHCAALTYAPYFVLTMGWVITHDCRARWVLHDTHGVGGITV